jgi:tetratricopeptide (TPR) repeat protein
MEGEPLAAIAYMRRAVGILETSEDTLALAQAHLHFSQILLLEGDFGEAEPHIERAGRLIELGAADPERGMLRVQQAHLAVHREEPERAVQLANDALALLEEQSTEQGSAWHALGLAQALQGDVDAAGESFARAVELLRHGGEWREATSAYRAWSRMLQSAGQTQEAIKVLDQATVLSIRYGRRR